MSKLFKRFSGITLGLALCFGFSFSCSNKSSSSQMARAAATDGTECVLWSSGYAASTDYTTSDDGAIKWVNSAANTYSSPTRIYANNTFTIMIADSTIASSINGVVVVASSSGYATAANNATWTVDDGASIAKTLSGSTITAATTGTVTQITINPTAQTRWSSVTVYYEEANSGTSYTSYNITFHYNDGITNDSVVASSTSTGKISKPSDPTWEGHAFSGWYSDNNTFENLFDFNSVIASDCDVYAKWLSDSDIATSVANMISTIGEVSYLKKEQIIAARNAYNALTDTQKGLVNNLDVLEAAEAYLNTYVQFSNNLTSDSTKAITTTDERVIGDFVVYDFANIYDGANSTLKMSSSSKNGSFRLRLSDELTNNNNIISSISVVAKQYSNDSARIDIEGTSELTESMNLTSEYTEKLFDLEEQKTNSVQIKSVNRSYVSGIKVNYKAVTVALEENLTVSGTLAKVSYYEDETFELNGLTITAHYDDGSSNDVTNAVTLANDGVLAAGQTSIVVTYTVGEESASVTITGFTVAEYESVNYGRIGNGVETYDGEYYIAYVNGDSAKVWNCNLNDEANSYVSTTVVNNSIASTKPLEQCVVTFEAIRNENEEITGYSLKTPSGKYVGGSGTGNHVVGWENFASFTIEINNDGTAKLANQSKNDPKILCFNFANDQNKLRYYSNTSSSVGYITLFRKNSSPINSNYDIFDNFVTEYMHFNDVEIDNNSDTGECRGESGYYRTAIGAFNNLSFEQRSLIVDSRYSDTFNRLYAWALANGEELNMDTVQFEALKKNFTNNNVDIFSTENDSSLIILFVVCTLGAGALSAFYLMKKKKRA